MIRECKVLVNNKAVTVVEFDGTKIQMPAIGRNAETIFVSSENGKYRPVEKGYIENKTNAEETPLFKRRTIKKATMEKNAEEGAPAPGNEE